MRLCDRFNGGGVKASLEKTWTMMLFLYCSLAALVIAIVTIRFFTDMLSENEVTLHLSDLHWGVGLALLALIVLRVAWSPGIGTSNPALSKMPWQPWAARIVDFILVLSAVLLPASGASMTLWNGHDIEWLGQVLILAGPKSIELRSLSLVLHETAAVLLALSLASRLILALAFAEPRCIWDRFR